MENKITEDKMVEFIIDEVPEFSCILYKEHEYWGDDEFPIGLQVAEFSRFVYNEMVKKNKNKELLSRCFDVVEKLLNIGDEVVKNNIYFFYIENLSNEYDGYTEEELRSYMGPKSLKALDRINAFWMEGKIIESLD